jgi:hypothetical protein
MARGDREAALGTMLAELGYARSPESRVEHVRPAPRTPRVPGLPASAEHWVRDLYAQLGGIQSEPRLAPRGWDHPLDGFIVELDEEQHFNRYRALTLTSDWTRALPWRESYLRYCEQYEQIALKKHSSLGFWTKPGAEAQFGRSASPRDLSGVGSARWKQRALYDAMRDALAAIGGVNLVRVAVWDKVGSRTLGEVLRGPAASDLEMLEELIAQRKSAPGH